MSDHLNVTGTPPPSPRAGRHVVSRQVGAGAVLIHLRTNQIYELNAQGARIWQLIQEGLNREAIVDALEREFEADRTRIGSDVDVLLSGLVDAGLVEA